LEQLIKNTPPNGSMEITPPRLEIEGPLVIDRPITIMGNGATIWARRGPVLSIRSQDVQLEKLNLEVTDRKPGKTPKANCALLVDGVKDPKLSDVSIQGNVIGLKGEKRRWHCPHSIRVYVPSNRSCEIPLRFSIPMSCHLEVVSSGGLDVSPSQIKGGDDSPITLKLDPLPSGQRRFGRIVVRNSALTRYIFIRASAHDDVFGPGLLRIEYWGKKTDLELWKPAEIDQSMYLLWRLKRFFLKKACNRMSATLKKLKGQNKGEIMKTLNLMSDKEKEQFPASTSLMLSWLMKEHLKSGDTKALGKVTTLLSQQVMQIPLGQATSALWVDFMIPKLRKCKDQPAGIRAALEVYKCFRSRGHEPIAELENLVAACMHWRLEDLDVGSLYVEYLWYERSSRKDVFYKKVLNALRLLAAPVLARKYSYQLNRIIKAVLKYQWADENLYKLSQRKTTDQRQQMM